MTLKMSEYQEYLTNSEETYGGERREQRMRGSGGHSL